MTGWPTDGCPVCGYAWNDWCVQYHLPYARTMLTEQEIKTERIRMKVEAGERYAANIPD